MLRLLLLLPLCGALLVALLPRRRAELLWRVALASTVATLLLAWSLLWQFDTAAAGIQLFETHVWNPRLGSTFSLGVDGLALSMVLLTSVLFVVTTLTSGRLAQGTKLYYALLLLLESAVLGVFMARDWSLFYVFWELTLIPLFFIIDRLGGENRQRAALNFVLYTMGGSVFMLVALLLLYDHTPAHSFAMHAIAEAARGLPADTQLWIFVGLAIGFGVKVPIFPLHGWLQPVYSEAPTGVALVSSGTLLKMGAYGLLRAAETLPAGLAQLATTLAALATVNLVYGALMAWRQTDLKSMLAYSSISHMGVVLLGIAALNPNGINGAMFQMLAHGLAAALLFLLAGALVQRTGCRDLGDYGNLTPHMPRAATCLALGFIAALGLPGSAGFVAELQVLIGVFSRWGAPAVALSLAMLIGAAYSLRSLGRLLLGPDASRIGGQALSDLNRSESLAALLLLTGLIALGLHPAPVLQLLAAPAAAIAAFFP